MRGGDAAVEAREVEGVDFAGVLGGVGFMTSANLPEATVTPVVDLGLGDEVLREEESRSPTALNPRWRAVGRLPDARARSSAPEAYSPKARNPRWSAVGLSLGTDRVGASAFLGGAGVFLVVVILRSYGFPRGMVISC
jgi:hypothetical protein